jgi:hypothetical protein
MKLRYLFFSALICMFLLAVDASAQVAGRGCERNAAGNLTGKRAGIFYTDCFPRNAGEQNDTRRLKDAIAYMNVAATATNLDPNSPSYLGQGCCKLIFNEGTYVINDTLDLNSNMILEGTSSSAGDTKASSRISLTVQNKSIFRIQGGVTEVAIRDIGLSFNPPITTPSAMPITNAGTVGIEGHNLNAYAEPLKPRLSSSNFQFTNLTFVGFEKGIYIHPQGDDNFQFDNAKLDRVLFANCNTAIKLNSSNTGWTISNVNINSGENQNGIDIIKGGYISMNLIVGNGLKGSQTPNGPMALSGTFIKIRKLSTISIQNASTENFVKSLDVDSETPYDPNDFPLVLNNNTFSEGVEIGNTTVVSTGNFYGNFWKVSNPVIKGNSTVFSIGDKFCWRTTPTIGVFNSFCAGSKFVLQGTSATLQQLANINDLSAVNEDIQGSAARPFLKLLHPTENKTLLELGNYDVNGKEYVYRLKRESNGRLSFTANTEIEVTGKSKGFNFDAPLRLKNYLYNEVRTYAKAILTDGDFSC